MHSLSKRNLFRTIFEMSNIILHQLVLCKAALRFERKNSREHLSYHLILVSVVNEQLVKSEILRNKKKKIENLQSLLTSIISLARCDEDNGFCQDVVFRF